MTVRVFGIGWEYPPHITGGLGVACQGLLKALGKRDVETSFLLPRLYGDEEELKGVKLVEPADYLDEFTPAERRELDRIYLSRRQELKERSASGKPGHSVGQAYSAYASEFYTPVNEVFDSTGSDQERVQDETEIGAAGDLHLPEFKGGYGRSLYREIHDYARVAAILSAHLDFDLIHAHDWMSFPAGLAVRNLTGKPLLCHVHATEFDRSGDNPNPYTYDLEKNAFEQCNHIVSVSGYTRGVLIDKFGIPGDKVSVVHNGVDFKEDVPQDGPVEDYVARQSSDEAEKTIDDKVVLFLGRMTFQKGPDYFVQAAKIVLERMGNVRFVMAGGGDMYHRMIELAADLGIGGHFHYTGPLTREDVSRMYAMSDLYILPSVSEPFGITPLEAISHNVPVIMSKQAGVSEIVQGCLKVDFWNVQELAEKIIILLNDSTLADSLRTHSYQEARKITWGRAADKLIEVYKNILAATNVPSVQ